MYIRGAGAPATAATTAALNMVIKCQSWITTQSAAAAYRKQGHTVTTGYLSVRFDGELMSIRDFLLMAQTDFYGQNI